MTVGILVVALAASFASGPASPPERLTALCASIASHVDMIGGSGDGPLFLPSYEPGPAETSLPPPLATSAFSYDNALAVMALIACNDAKRARRIGDAFVEVIAHDRTFTDGRVRNAYRAGPTAAGPTKLPGWWDSKQNLWAEDPYQDGTQTGNVAWVGLAMLTLHAVDTSERYHQAAVALATWIADHASDPRAPGGYNGGVDGYDPSQATLAWRSTEHNVDVNALGSWLNSDGSSAVGRHLAQTSRAFLDAMFDGQAGMFRLGTKPDGTVQPADRLALDAMIWPLVGVADPSPAWRRSLTFARAHLAVPGGFDFNGDRDGFWTEGTAQAAFVEGALGDETRRKSLLTAAARLTGPSGYLYATGSGRITTGIAIGPGSTSEDFYYYHRPHLGATAWAVLAETGFNPFSGRKQ